MLGLVGRAIQPADPLSSGSSRLKGGLQAELPAPLSFAILLRNSDELESSVFGPGASGARRFKMEWSNFGASMTSCYPGESGGAGAVSASRARAEGFRKVSKVTREP
jgi:hypothetical protein